MMTAPSANSQAEMYLAKIILTQAEIKLKRLQEFAYISVQFSDASRSKKVENRARTRILDFQIFENENTENFLEYKSPRIENYIGIREFFWGLYRHNKGNLLFFDIAKFDLKALEK